MRVDVLGTKYTVIEKACKDEPMFYSNEAAGYCDPTVRQIVIRKDMPPVRNPVDNHQQIKQETIRHELMHAFFFEGGMTDWGQNEMLVEFMAVQFPKMQKAMQEAGGLD